MVLLPSITIKPINQKRLWKRKTTTMVLKTFTNGAREMFLAIIDSVNASKGRFLLDSAGKDSNVYHDAIVRLILENLDNTQKFLMKNPIGYRNHVRDKKGKLVSCEAYFVH